MSNRLVELQRKQARLRERIAIQRVDLAEHFEPLAAALESTARVGDRFSSVLTYLKTHPLQIAAVVSALAMLKPALAGRWLVRGVGLWKTWRTVRRLKAVIPASWLTSVLARWF